MTWTTLMPSKEGWYWWQSSSKVIPAIMFVTRDGMAQLGGATRCHPVEMFCPANWAGPIQPPTGSGQEVL